MEGCIYLWTNKHNLKKYVGQHNKPDPIGRTKRHLMSAKSGCDYALHRAIRKWGFDAFTIEVLCVCTRSALGNLEAYFAEQHESYIWQHGYNMVMCGPAPTLGMKRSPGAIEKTRQANLGRKNTPEAIGRMRQAALGRKRAPESIERARQAVLGKKRTPETKEKIRQAALGRKRSPETVEKLRQAKFAYWAKKRAEAAGVK